MSYEIVGSPEKDGKKWVVLGRCACGAERKFRCKADGTLQKPATECRRCRDERRRIDPAFAAKMSDVNRVHGHSETSAHNASATHRSWSAMLTRCTNEEAKDYDRYGGAGIRVSSLWTGLGGFEHFLADMGERPPGTSLDRFPDPTGDYEPGNCRWATPAEQANNRTDNVTLSVDGERLTLTEASTRYGVPRGAIEQRLRLGWPDEQAAKTASTANAPATEFTLVLDGETITVAEASRRYGVRRNVLHWRLFAAQPPWSPRQAVGLDPRTRTRRRAWEKPDST